MNETSLLCVREGSTGIPVKVVERLGGRERFLGRQLDLGLAIFARYSRHHGAVLGAGLAFFTALAIAPLAIAFGALAGLIIDPTRLDTAMAELVQRVPSAAVLESFVNALSQFARSTSATGFSIAGVVGIVVALFGASRIVVATRQILDVAFEHPHARRGFVMRAMSILTILVAVAVGLLLVLVVTVVPVILVALGVDGALRTLIAGPLVWGVLLFLLYLVVRIIYHFGPVKGRSRRLWSLPAAAVTVWIVLMTLGLNIYVSASSTWNVAVSVLGGAAVLLLWLYMSAVGIVLGAEWSGLRESERPPSP